MPNLTIEDSITKIGLSTRSHNALRRAGVHTVSALLEYDRDKLPAISNFGAKCILEVESFLDSIHSKSEESFVVSFEEVRENEKSVLFRDARGVLCADMPIEELGLSVRCYNCLKGSGYNFASQLIEISETDLLSIRNLGQKSKEEILSKVETLRFVSAEESNHPCQSTVSALASFLPVHGGLLYQELLPLFENSEENESRVLAEDIFSNDYLRGAIKQKIVAYLSDFPFGIELHKIMSQIPENVISHNITEEIILEMESDGQLLIEDKIKPRRMTSFDYAHSIKNEIHRDIFLKRLQGVTLEEIGGQYRLTRERIRQIIGKYIYRKKMILTEDKYIAVYKKYELSRKDFVLAFGEDESVYNYLTMGKEKRGTIPLEQLLTDESFPDEIRRGAEKVVYKDCVIIGGERIYRGRPEIADYVIRTYCQDDTLFEDFIEYYEMVLNDLGLSENDRFTINPGTYVNRLADHDKVLWKLGRRFRYYDLGAYDFSEFWQELAFEQYNDIEYSTRKFFKEHPALMRRYNIRDEYELHNLLKKLCKKENRENITISRMPMIEFGNTNRAEQVLDMLIQLSPVVAQDFATAYEEEYGVQAATVMSNFLKSFDAYFHNGVYDISTLPLPVGQADVLVKILTDDYYEISDVKRIYQREFSGEPMENVNPHTLKTLGFSVYASYVIKNIYPSAAEYFRYLLTYEDIIDVRTFPFGVTGKVSYTSELMALKSRYEIIEFEPYCFINIRRLNSIGVSVESIRAYCDSVDEHIGLGSYFTISSLRNSGFSHTLDDLGFDEMFYSSLLTEDKRRYSYQRIGHTKLLFRGGSGTSFKAFIDYIVSEKASIGVFELVKLLDEHYGMHIDRWKIIETVKSSSMHYDAIMEKVYTDYDTYFEEV